VPVKSVIAWDLSVIGKKKDGFGEEERVICELNVNVTKYDNMVLLSCQLDNYMVLVSNGVE